MCGCTKLLYGLCQLLLSALQANLVGSGALPYHQATAVAVLLTAAAYHASNTALQQAIHACSLLAAAYAHGTGVLLLLEDIQCRQAGAIYEQVPASVEQALNQLAAWAVPQLQGQHAFRQHAACYELGMLKCLICMPSHKGKVLPSSKSDAL
jgi:hypothetical protein